MQEPTAEHEEETYCTYVEFAARSNRHYVCEFSARSNGQWQSLDGREDVT